VPESALSVILSNGRRLPARVVKAGSAGADSEMSGQDLALLKLEAANLPSLILGDSTALKLGDRLHILGFPRAVLTHELLSASARVEASVTSGAVSGFREDRSGQPVIQTDAPAEGGNSGGPTVNERGEVVGVLTFVTASRRDESAPVQGFNFVIPSSAVREFIAGTGVPIGAPGPFDTAWHDALRRFFDGDHRGARGPLAEADRLLPGLPDVMRIQRENEERAARQPLLPWRMVGAGLTLAGLGGYGGLLVSRMRRNRFRISPAEAARLLDAAVPPVLLDVRAPAAFESSPVRLPGSLHVSPERLERGDLGVPIEPDRTVVAYCT
jgi:hypothetical protein